MLSRLLSRLVILASIATLAGVTFYFMDEYRVLRERERALDRLTSLAADDGPCAALEAIRQHPAADGDVQQTLQALRGRLVGEVAGNGDASTRRVLLAAEREGILDRGLCEQIRLAQEVGEPHPVLTMLRYTREGGSPCDDEPHLAGVLDGLSSHRSLMLHALMRNVPQLGCLSPGLSEKIGAMAAAAVSEEPRLLDDLDVVRVAGFIGQWAPLEAAQLGCRAEARGEVSAVASTIGCTPEARRRILVRYRTGQVVPPQGAALGLPAGSQVVLLGEAGPFCEVTSASEAGELHTVACSTLQLASDLVIAARIEALSYGRAEADLIAGLGAYGAEDAALRAAGDEPELRSWFGYDREGELVGSAHRVELGAMAAMLGERVPDEPLRAFCRRTGAKYCYDVDWAHVVSRLGGEPVLFLSRPARVFLPQAPLAPEETRARFAVAFGHEPVGETFGRVYALAGGGELVVNTGGDELALRWRLAGERTWRAQAFGRSEGGDTPPAVRLLAALDVQQDGRPELVIQRATYVVEGGAPQRVADELLFLHLADAGDRFTLLNRLTVHEY